MDSGQLEKLNRMNKHFYEFILFDEDQLSIIHEEKPDMARITVEDCLSKVGNENRFALIHLAVARVKQHRKGKPFLTKGKNKENVMTLREIAAGQVSFDNLEELGREKPEPPTPEADTVPAANSVE